MLKVEQLKIAYENFRIDVENALFSEGLNIILGPNGGGKSSFMSGVIGYDQLDIELREIYWNNQPLGRVHNIISYLPQENPRFKITVADYLVMTTGNVSTDAYSTAVEHFNIAQLTGRSIEALSGGEFKRVQCAQVSLENKPVIMIDEMEQGLDLKYQHEMMKWVKGEGGHRTVIASMHDAALALTYADTITLVKGGRITGPMPPGAVTPEMLSACYGLPLEIESRAGSTLVYHRQL
ncbi:ATP-binding cassette domain-containing protein [Salinicoccus hispanicus]|uniref:ATP-binding cassette domain-containing protein n=1 Tax=Salinicoccus hispanicus TaxID=157225 RepID=A0A6N8TZ95_9STAP|nr:ABC transporter ATP-binding protein [Salinicoccus hispanicus]MXQ51164.1 ATP-binding cassette domain-containing protein [Salinicoccus hispanicus]